MKSLSDINIEKSRSGVYKDNEENRRLHRVGQRYGSTGGSDIEDLKKDKKENSEKEGKFSRVNLPDIPGAHKVNLTKYLSAKRKKAVDDAWDKAKFDSLTREKVGVFQEGYNKLREQFNNNFDGMSKSKRAELLYKILKMKNAMEKFSVSPVRSSNKERSEDFY